MSRSILNEWGVSSGKSFIHPMLDLNIHIEKLYYTNRISIIQW